MESKYQIFISYRRDGGASLARLLEYKLTDRGFKVFFDVESLRSGDFNKALFEKIAECTDVVVVLPPHGLDRCTDPHDWVRLEIARALKLKKNVVPVMMHNFKFPDVLPEDIDAIRNKNGVEANNQYFDATIDLLISKRLNSKILNSDEQLLKEAQDGNLSAMNTIAVRYEFTTEPMIDNRKKAFAFYEQAADKDYLGAWYNLGDIYEQCEKDLSRVYDYGIENLIAGKNAGDSRKELHKLAVACYTKAKDENFAPAVYRLANLAEESRDFKKAFELYQMAANLDYPAAQNAMGYYKMKGLGTDVDRKAAVDWYAKAAQADYSPAIYNYAHAMELNNIVIAIQFYEKVAYTIPQAAFSLARLYERSLHDLKKAVDYYRIAYESGIQEAGEKLRHCQDILFK